MSNRSLDWLAREFAARIGPAIGAMTGQRTEASAAEDGTPSFEAGDLIWRQGLDAAADALLWLGISARLWTNTGKQVLATAGLDEFEDSEVQSTFMEVLQQAIAPLCTALGAKLGREVLLERGEIVAAPPADLGWQRVEVRAEDGSLTAVWVAGNAPLLDVVEGEKPIQPEVVASGEVASARAVAAARSSRTLDLLMEVELPVGVSFGRAQMRLKDAIKLTTGSIVELNRSIVEPVEIIVNNCVIARGEVVVVEGNYGVRIREIVSREERLRTLF